MNNTPQNLVWLGTPFFAPKLKDYGWKNVHIHYFPSFQVFGWEDILEMAGFEPDVMVYGDCSRPPPLSWAWKLTPATGFRTGQKHLRKMWSEFSRRELPPSWSGA